jgi:hypothetical protein
MRAEPVPAPDQVVNTRTGEVLRVTVVGEPERRDCGCLRR